ncbi:hypothetical protein [Prochlorococcus marinus]|uniref:hypothetical protein n=1 Tax=Prochlorococcus TaxID=1218 RepID=UPI0007BBDDA2|nr:hypothetical protein [Prochlorococcus marinus]KZR75680.1 hypothetical protein PMIT1323_01974 [Prochlorococcus marinus str. MIT 1323]
MSNKLPQKPLSERRAGYALAILGGTLGLPIGWFISPLVLFILNKKLKGEGDNKPNRFLVWSLIGIAGAPICLIAFSPFTSNDLSTRQQIAFDECKAWRDSVNINYNIDYGDRGLEQEWSHSECLLIEDEDPNYALVFFDEGGLKEGKTYSQEWLQKNIVNKKRKFIVKD